MILERANIRCFGIKNDKSIDLQKTYKGLTIEQAIEKARKLFKAFLIENDVSEYEFNKTKFKFGVYISDGRPYSDEKCSIMVTIIDVEY